jgi:hypothetical protein
MCVCYNLCHCNAVKGFWTLWDNIYECVFVITFAIVMLLRDFGPYGIIFMTVCLLLYILPPFFMFSLLVRFDKAALLHTLIIDTRITQSVKCLAVGWTLRGLISGWSLDFIFAACLYWHLRPPSLLLSGTEQSFLWDKLVRA